MSPTSPMPVTGWDAERGDKWRFHLDGMEATLAPIDEPLIDVLRLDVGRVATPARIADVACGGGGTTFAIARRAPAGSDVRGFDISPSLIETARGRAAWEGPEVVFEGADIATASPPGGPFDRLCSRFGVMFFEDPPAAFANLAGWLAPGGRFAFAVWASVADNPLITIVRDAVRHVADVPVPNPAAPGPYRYGDAEVLRGLLDAAGFADIEVVDWRGSLAFGGGLPPADAASFAISALSVAEELAKADEAARGEAHRALTEGFERHVQDGVVRLEARVHLFTGGRGRGDR